LSAKIIAKAWFFGGRQILFGKRMKLWVPIPGIATHLDSQALAPAIDWIALMKEQAEAIELESTKRHASVATRTNALVTSEEDRRC
jgi:hypothetical protein